MGTFISVVVNTLNEERRLPYALRSVESWADEIVVVDMGSDDGTVSVAERFGARVFTHARTGFVEPARAFACAQARGNWVLVLDADELIPSPLARRLRQVAETEDADVVRLPRLNYLLGRPVLHSGWNPGRDRHVRFFRPGCVELSARIHEPPRPLPTARVLDLPAGPGLAIVHFNYADVSHFLQKLDRYTGVEAAQARERGERAGRWRAAAAAAREWGVRYLGHGGYRDGWRGFHLCLFMAFYRLVTFAKLQELEDSAGRPGDVVERYRDEAERWLAGYRSG